MSAPDGSSRPRGRGAEQARATRAALVELAAEMFAERGYAQTSVRHIARRGELSSGAIYGHFRNKAELLAEAISVLTAEEPEAPTLGRSDDDLDYIETLTQLARDYGKRRRLRALIVQGVLVAVGSEHRLHRSEQLHLGAPSPERRPQRRRIDSVNFFGRQPAGLRPGCVSGTLGCWCTGWDGPTTPGFRATSGELRHHLDELDMTR